MIKLKREQYRYNEKDRLDVTVKGAKGFAKWLAPTWKMVMGHKDGSLSDEEYIKMYLSKLEGTPSFVISELEKLGPEITFVCFCANGSFCHTYLLMDYLVEHFPTKFKRMNNETME